MLDSQGVDCNKGSNNISVVTMTNIFENLLYIRHCVSPFYVIILILTTLYEMGIIKTLYWQINLGLERFSTWR